MPKKQKIDKRLNQLFKDIQAEENPSKRKRTKGTQEALSPVSDIPSTQATSSKPAPKSPVTVSKPRTAKPQTAAMPQLDVAKADLINGHASRMALTFQAGEQNWATLQVVDETASRSWSQNEQLLVKQVADQLSLALENARLFQEISSNEIQLTEALNIARLANWEYDFITGTFTFNDQFFEVMRTTAEREGGYIMSSAQYNKRFVHPDDLTVVSNEFQKAVLTDDPDFSSTTEHRVLFGDGSLGYVSVRFRITKDENGRTVKSIGANQDITERKKAEEDLTRFKLGIESSGDAVFMTNIDGEIIYANPSFETIYGYKREEALGKNPRILKSGVIPQEQYQHFWNTLLSKQTVSGEIINKSKNGRLVNIAGTNSPILDENGNILGFLAVHHDITSLKQAEEALQKRNAYLSVSSEIGRLVTSTLDLNTIFSRTVNLISERFNLYHAAIYILEETGFNAILREATGFAGDEMKKQEHTIAIGSESIVGKVTTTGSPVVVNDVIADHFHKTNPLLPGTRTEAAIPLRVGNRIIGALDIHSTSVNAFPEDEIAVLQILADQVAVAIDNARSYELSQQAVLEMREIDRLKSQFLANMSHELRTPLNSIIGFSRVILKGIDGPVTELQQQDLTAIYNSGQHLLGLINDILDLSKIEAGKMELAFDEVNMTDVTNSVLSTMTGLIKDKSIMLKRNIQTNLPTVRADAIRVRQVMINLLSNAAKFTDEGEIVVDVEVKPGTAGRPELMVSVTDTGPGIAPQDQGKLFQPFSQVDDSPTRKTGGTGLGLSICQHLIQMHGGRIGVISDIGKGSTFYFTLPLYRKEIESDTPSGSGKVILAIDDDPQVIGLYERYLQPQGYQVISLTDPSRAVERVRQLKPFAVTLDIMMPGIDGWQVLNNLKSDMGTRDIPVIICSIVEDLEKGFSLGASDYLVKPILEEDLVNSLDRLNADGSIREVLVIDDDANDLRLIGKMLNNDGRYRPILAQGGVKGWEIISSKNPPHAVILDLFMPEMNGFLILENMRGDKKLRDIPVIVLSGMELTPDQQKQLADFGQRLLTKGSFNEKELFTTIQRSLQRVPAR